MRADIAKEIEIITTSLERLKEILEPLKEINTLEEPQQKKRGRKPKPVVESDDVKRLKELVKEYETLEGVDATEFYKQKLENEEYLPILPNDAKRFDKNESINDVFVFENNLYKRYKGSPTRGAYKKLKFVYDLRNKQKVYRLSYLTNDKKEHSMIYNLPDED